MKIGIVGAGPAGLYFALLMKRANPAHEIILVEQNPRGATYGWGIVFSGRALAFLADHDTATYQELSAHLREWDELHIVHRDEQVAVDGSRFSGIARTTLLEVLRRHCLAAGITIHFNHPLRNPTELWDGLGKDCDLLVGADGVNSVVRNAYAFHFSPTIHTLSNKYIWYGTPHSFPALSLIFRSNADGHFVAHAYPYSHTTSTFIVECDAATWQRANFDAKSDAENRAYCQRLFAPDLQGRPLLSNKSNWLSFRAVHNRQWHHRHVVLLGDALRTLHFSIGSGTRTAIEDAIGLFEACQTHGEDVAQALTTFEARRRPDSEQLLTTAQKSSLWHEQFPQYLHLAPLELAYAYMMRSGQVTAAKLAQHAPRFMAAYQAHHT